MRLPGLAFIDTIQMFSLIQEGASVDEIVVETGARLHFGPLAAGGAFGGVGVMIADPGLRLRVAAIPAGAGSVALAQDVVPGDGGVVGDEIVAPADWVPRIERTLRTFRESNSEAVPPCRVRLERMIPGHVGLGSGTQLGLAVGQGLLALLGQSRTPSQLARQTGRGLRSAIGLHGFLGGGFLVDAGKSGREGLGQLAVRCDFPSEWPWILVRSRDAIGLCGAAEVQVFAKSPAMSEELTQRLCRLVLMQWLPAIQAADFEGCSRSLREYGERVGEYFAPIQGGTFADPQAQAILRIAEAHGVTGIAQSSWGPTLALLTPSTVVAEKLCQELSQLDVDWQVTTALNDGARVHRISGVPERSPAAYR